MSGLKLGDLTLDPRRAVYISSIRALVCSDVVAGLQSSISAGLRGVVERIDSLCASYNPQTLVFLESAVNQKADAFSGALSLIVRRWCATRQAHLVGSDLSAELLAIADTKGCEVHGELVWGKYRFVGREDPEKMELQLLTITGSPNFAVRLGSTPFGGMKLPAFSKSFARLTIPSSDPLAEGRSVFRRSLDRADVFAVGHQRILPLGKVADLRAVRGIARGLPISRATLGARRKDQKAPSAD